MSVAQAVDRDAAADLSVSIAHDRDDYQPWLLRARIDAERGQIAAAARDYRQARRLDPLGSAFGSG